MTDTPPNDQQQPNHFAETSDRIQKIKDQINSVVIGQEQVVEQLLVTLLASGHLLLEGVPGLGKTLLIQTLSKLCACDFRRIQFTPDLMPADITGHTLYDMQEGKFRIRKGPIFTQFLLADEINRAPAKTQAALLEVMQERQVTIEGESLPLKPPFTVLATQNPLEQEGTYPLPEAELDRFLLKVVMQYPSIDAEKQLTQNVIKGSIENFIQSTGSSLCNAQDILKMQALCKQVLIDDQVLDYAVRLVIATRETNQLVQGAGPRATIGLARAAQAQALIRGRDYVLPDDVKQLFHPVLRHRVTLSAESEIDGLNADNILTAIIEKTDAPR